MLSSDVSRFTFYASRLWNHDAPAIKWALVIFVTMRLSLSLIAAIALYQFPLYHVTYYHGIQPVPPGIADYLLGVWQRFDSIWYTKIAMQGYSQGDGTTVFFPLYPLLTRIVGKVLWGNYLLGGIVVSNAAYFLALVYLHKLTQLELDSEAAARTVVYLSVFPTAFFFLGVYTESLFLLFAVAAFYHARKGNWLAASMAGLLAALTKQLGLLLLLPLLYEYLLDGRRSPDRSQLRLGQETFGDQVSPSSPMGEGLPTEPSSASVRDLRRSRIRRDVLLLALIPLGTLAFLLYRHFCIGEPFLVVETYRTQWAVHASWPWSNIRDSLMAIFRTSKFAPLDPEDTLGRRIFYNALDLACVGLFVFLAVASFRRLRLSYGLYMVSVLFVALMQNFRPPYPIAAVPRYVLVQFPGFMALGTMVKSKALHWAIVHSSTLLLGLFTAMFATWRVVA